PRCQAGEHLPHAVGTHQAARLRRGGHASAPRGSDGGPVVVLHRRDDSLHVSRTGARRRSRSPDRSVLAWHRPLPAGDACTALRVSIWLGAAAAIGVVAVAGSAWWAISAVRGRSVSAASAEEVKAPPHRADVQLRTEKQSPAESTPEPVRTAASAAAARPTLASSARQDSTPPSPSPPAVVAARIEPPPADAAPSSAQDQFLIARQQIDLRLYDQAIESLRKVAQGSNHEQ